MDYVCVMFDLADRVNASDIIIALLSDTDYEMFEENANELKAFIPSAKFSEEQVQSIISETDILNDVAFTTEVIKHQNWNEIWE